MQQRTSTYFAAAPAADAFAAIGSVRKRTRQQRGASARDGARVAAARSSGSAAAQLTEMEKQVVAIRAQHPDMLLLFECGYRMRVFADDAENAAAVLGIRVHAYKSFRQASVPVFRTLHHCRRLVDAGFKVGIVRQTETVAMHARASSISASAGATRRPLLQRSVVDVYTRATIPLPEAADHDEDAEDVDAAEREHEPLTRFILSVVEETEHHAALFRRKLHDVSDSTGSASKQAAEITIGIFAHDVHIGESVYEEFHDDATRRHLRELLDLLRPIELVLPVGKLSAYTERLLHNYANPREEIAQCHGLRQQQQQQKEKRIRIERLENAHFDWHDARTRFTMFFDAAEHEYSNFSARPSLPVLSTCCFGGMWAYLEALQLEKTLISAKYSRAVAASTPSTQTFTLPSESLYDLDIFRNATTGKINGSLFSILNYTKTEPGARRLREWMSSPSMSIAQIEERQDTIQRMAFTSCESMPASTSYHLIYEELVTSVLPASRSLQRSIQRIHTRKVTPAQLVQGLEALITVELRVEHMIEIASVARTEHLQLGSNQEPHLLLRLLHTYPRMNTLLSTCLSEIRREEAAVNDTEGAMLQRLQMDSELITPYRRLQSELRALEDEFNSVLETARQHFQDPSLEFSVLRSGSAKTTSHLICVGRDKLHLVPPDWLVVNSTKKVVRFHPKAIFQLHMRHDYLQQMKKQLVEAAWLDFVAQVDARIYVTTSDCVDKLASLDAICSLATLARMQHNYTRPTFMNVTQETDAGARPHQVLEIVDGRNPIIETNLSRGASYITNSVSMPSRSCGALLAISGPNMGGKSSFLRMCALIVLMAQIGSFVPAQSVRLSIFDGIHTRMQRSTALSQQRGHSPLSATMASSRQQEMTALSKICRAVTSRSLVLLDEIGFGMTLQQADAFAHGVMVYLVDNVGCQVLFATHMTSLVRRLERHLQGKCHAKKVGYNLVADDTLLSMQRGWQVSQREY